MATWEDGPEYAPRVRPSAFTEPEAVPLSEAPPAAALPDVPVDRPGFAEPAQPVAPLATLVPAAKDPRDPAVPFEVVTTTVTGDSAWGSVHESASTPPAVGYAQPAPSGAGAIGSPYDTAAPVASGVPDPWPRTQVLPVDQVRDPYAAPNGFPQPGTPAWFSPPPPYGGSSERPRVDAQQVVQAATPGLCITLAVGGLIYLLAPIMVMLSLGLAARVAVARDHVRTAARVAVGGVAFAGLIGALRPDNGPNGWWTFVGLWSLVICWGLLVTVLVLVYRGLRQPPAVPPPSPWG